MKWIGERISYVDQKDGITTFVIYPEKVIWKNNLLSAWLTVWVLIGGYVIYSLFKDYTREEKLVLIVFLSFWLYFLVRVGRATLWQLKGKELIRINDQVLMIKRSIFSYGKAQSYFLENISKVKIEEVKESNLGFQFERSIWVVGGEKLSFEYQGKTVRLGRKLNETDAKLFFRVLTNRIEQRVRKKKN